MKFIIGYMCGVATSLILGVVVAYVAATTF